MKYIKGFTACLLLGVLISSLASCSGKDKTQDIQGDGKEEVPVVKVETVYERDVIQKGVYTASVDADITNNISSSTPNRIKEIYVDEGMDVAKGQKLVVLDDVNIVAYEAQVTNAKSNLDNAKANLNNVQLNYNRAVELFNIGGGTKQNVDAMETQLINAKNSVTAAERALASAQRTLTNARENTVLTSPISGVVTKRNYDPGDMTGAMPILTIARIQPVKVVCNISESDYSKVSKNMAAEITLDTYGDEVFTGNVSMISPIIDSNTRTFGIEILVPNKDNKILPGMFGRVTLNLGEMQHVVVPDKAVIKQPGSGNQYVYVYKDGKVSYNLVKLGQRLDNAYEILSGVENGDQVVVSGQAGLVNGAQVKVIE